MIGEVEQDSLDDEGAALLNKIRFTRALLRNPKSVGAVVPSSMQLAEQMVEALPADATVVVEFGGGTGPVTKAVLDSGFAPENLYVFELSEKLYKHLSGKFPTVNIVHACASDIVQLDCDVSGIISSLPLKSLSDDAVAEILAAALQKLRPGGYFVQFTYDLVKYHRLFDQGFRHVSKRLVWANLPPARIDVFQKIS